MHYTYRPAFSQKSAVTSINGMIFEKGLLLFESITNAQFAFDVFLTTIHHGNVTTTERNDLVEKNIRAVGSVVHQVDFCEDADCSVS